MELVSASGYGYFTGTPPAVIPFLPVLMTTGKEVHKVATLRSWNLLNKTLFGKRYNHLVFLTIIPPDPCNPLSPLGGGIPLAGKKKSPIISGMDSRNNTGIILRTYIYRIQTGLL